MSFYLNRTGASEGPFVEQQIVAMIQRGELVQGHICPVGRQDWQPLNSHPAFAAALAQRQQPAQAPGPAQSPHGQPQGGFAPPAGAYGQPPAAYAQPPAAYAQPPAAYAQPPAAYAQPPAAYAQPPAAYGPPGAAPAYAQSPGQMGGGAPGYGAPAGYAPPGPAANAAYAPAQGAQPVPGFAPAKKKGGKGVVIGIVVALVVLGGGAALAYWIFFGNGPEIAAAVPRDTEFFMEIPSLKKVALDSRDIAFLDKSAKDEKVIDDATTAFVAAFDISKEDAQKLLLSAESLGVAVRKLTGHSDGAFALGFSSAGPVETFLSSKRFTQTGAFGDSGLKYQLAEKSPLDAAGKDVMKRGLFSLELKGTDDVLVWFPKKKILAAGSEKFVTDMSQVLERGAASLESNEAFKKARADYTSDARAIAFFDPSSVMADAGKEAKEVIDAYFKSAGPVTGDVRIKESGVLLDMTARFTGTKLPKSGMSEPIQLDLVKKLPAETFAYIAFTPRGKLTGADAEKLLLDQIRSSDPTSAVEFEQNLRQGEKTVGVTFARLFDALGNQAVFAAVAPDAFAFNPLRGSDQMTDLAAVAVIELTDQASYKTVLAKLKEQFGAALGEEAVIKEDGGNYTVTPKSGKPAVALQLKFLDKSMVAALGSDTLVTKALAAFSSGQGTLASSAAHTAAIGSLPDKAHWLMWVDTGRIGDVVLKSPFAKAAVDSLAIDLGKFKFSGDERITSAVSLDVETKDDVWTYRLHGLNAPALGMLAGASTMLSAAAAGASLAAVSPPTEFTPPPTLPVPEPVQTAVPTPPPAAAFDPATAKVGDKVDVDWNGKFYPSTILAVVGGDKFKIHYDGFASSWDEVVPSRRIRARQ